MAMTLDPVFFIPTIAVWTGTLLVRHFRLFVTISMANESCWIHFMRWIDCPSRKSILWRLCSFRSYVMPFSWTVKRISRKRVVHYKQGIPTLTSEWSTVVSLFNVEGHVVASQVCVVILKLFKKLIISPSSLKVVLKWSSECSAKLPRTIFLATWTKNWMRY
jgi:hypothetical protein